MRTSLSTRPPSSRTASLINSRASAFPAPRSRRAATARLPLIWRSLVWVSLPITFAGSVTISVASLTSGTALSLRALIRRQVGCRQRFLALGVPVDPGDPAGAGSQELPEAPHDRSAARSSLHIRADVRDGALPVELSKLGQLEVGDAPGLRAADPECPDPAHALARLRLEPLPRRDVDDLRVDDLAPGAAVAA